MLSGLLKYADLLTTVQRRGITRESFYQWHHGLAFARLIESPGPHGLFRRLHATGEWREWPNLPRWIAEVWELDPTGCDCEYAAVKVKRMEVRRVIMMRCRVIANEARERTQSPEEYEAILQRLPLPT